MFLTIFLATLVAILAAVWFWQNCQKQKSGFAQQYAAQKLPFVKMPNLLTQAFFGKQRELLELEAVKTNGKIFGTDLYGTKTIFVAEPELIQQIMSKEFTSFTNRRIFQIADPIFGSFLSLAQNETWKRLRSIVTPMFSSGSLKKMKPRIDDAIVTLLSNFENKLQSSNIIDIKELFGIFTVDVILQVAFGAKETSLYEPNNEIIVNTKKHFSKNLNFVSMLFFNILFRFPKLLALLSKFFPMDPDEKLAKLFKAISLQLINEKRKELNNTGSKLKPNNFLEMLLEAEKNNLEIFGPMENQGKNVKFMIKDEMISQCVLFFFAAYDTTSSTISLILYCLALNPSIQEQLYQEIAANLVKLKSDCSENTSMPFNSITLESLSELKYLNAVINETLRLFPPNSTSRTASNDIFLSAQNGSIQLDIRKGDVIHFPVYSIHRDSEQFPEPDTFNPDRFLSNSTFHKYAYLPFGQGPRNCVARSLALFETKLAILNVVYRYKFSVCTKTAIPMKFYCKAQNLTPKEVQLEIKKRSF